jgi:hemerythrin-like domain-containing protein
MSELCQPLEAEHRLIERVLAALDKEATGLESGEPVNTMFFAVAVTFVREFADGAHHQKEESILFERMEQLGIPKEGGPIGVMLIEHDEGRALIRTVESSVKAAAGGDAAARQTLIEAAHGFVMLLREHIEKEDGILYPMADHLFDETQKEAIRAAFRSADAGNAAVIKKHTAWAESLGCGWNGATGLETRAFERVCAS